MQLVDGLVGCERRVNGKYGGLGQLQGFEQQRRLESGGDWDDRQVSAQPRYLYLYQSGQARPVTLSHLRHGVLRQVQATERYR